MRLKKIPELLLLSGLALQVTGCQLSPPNQCPHISPPTLQWEDHPQGILILNESLEPFMLYLSQMEECVQ